DETCDYYDPATYGATAYEGFAVYEAGRLFNTGVSVASPDGGSPRAFNIKTYVVGLANDVTPTALNHIAAAGGTSKAFSTTDETPAIAALPNIIGGAIKTGTCDNTDNNCNGCTDEGFKHYCDVGLTCCYWGDDNARQTCLNNYLATITPQNPQGDLTK